MTATVEHVQQSRSVFAEAAMDMYASYALELRVRDKLMGGVPRNPKIIEGWLRAKAGVTDSEEIRIMTRRTLIEMGVQDLSEDATFDDMIKASESIAAERNTNGFKHDEGGLYVEGRQVKALIKESVNINFAGERWGRTKKGPLGFTAERVFVEPARIHLGIYEPDGIEMFIGHVNGPQGPRSTLGYYEYAQSPTISFRVDALDDCLDYEQWVRIWTHAERLGLGAVRSQGYGVFDVVRFEKIG